MKLKEFVGDTYYKEHQKLLLEQNTIVLKEYTLPKPNFTVYTPQINDVIYVADISGFDHSKKLSISYYKYKVLSFDVETDCYIVKNLSNGEINNIHNRNINKTFQDDMILVWCTFIFDNLKSLRDNMIIYKSILSDQGYEVKQHEIHKIPK